jgi:hypothetical protein
MRRHARDALLLCALLLPGFANALNLNQHGLTGSWFNPATSGQGIELEVYPGLGGAGRGQVFAGWFTFDTTAAGGQRWYALSGDVAADGAVANLGIYVQYGGNFDAPPALGAAAAVGQATLQFADCNHGALTYAFADGSHRAGTIPLTRLTPNVTCAAGGDDGSAAPGYRLSGSWFDPATSGQGLVFDFNPVAGLLFAGWYTFAPNGQQIGGPASQRWYVLQAPYAPGATSVSGIPIALATGGVFDDPAPAQTRVVGAASLLVRSCSEMTLSYAFDANTNQGASGSIDLTRAGPAPAGCSVAPPAPDPQYRVSAASPFAAGCDGVAANGIVYGDAEVEPSFAINPQDPANIVAAWQQDRWNNGGARGVVTAFSRDGGKTWAQHAMPFSRCGGGTSANGGDFGRATDPWLSAAPDGTLHLVAMGYSPGVSTVLASRSTDGGATWSAPVQVNGTPAAPAFTPTVHVRGDGTIGVSYFDLRPESPASTLMAAAWLARSIDATAWTESAIGEPFDMFRAPTSGGSDTFFVGDYQGLSSAGAVFVPLFVRTTPDAADRTGVFIAPQLSAPGVAGAKIHRAAAARFKVTPKLRARVNAHLSWALREGPPGKRD